MATKVITEDVPATHARFPPVSNLHKTVPIVPPGWVEASLRNVSGVTNVAYRISATARLTIR